MAAAKRRLEAVAQNPLATEILAHLADKYSRTKVGKAAKNKLQLLAR